MLLSYVAEILTHLLCTLIYCTCTFPSEFFVPNLQDPKSGNTSVALLQPMICCSTIDQSDDQVNTDRKRFNLFHITALANITGCPPPKKKTKKHEVACAVYLIALMDSDHNTETTDKKTAEHLHLGSFKSVSAVSFYYNNRFLNLNLNKVLGVLTALNSL